MNNKYEILKNTFGHNAFRSFDGHEGVASWDKLLFNLKVSTKT